MGKDQNRQLPTWMQKYFWETDLGDIDIERHRVYIIERLLNEGNDRTLGWLFSKYSHENIREAVKKSRSLSLKTARCWQNFFKLEEEELCCIGIRLAQKEKPF